MSVDIKPVTGPEHAREALRLGELANATYWADTLGERRPSEDERHRMLVTAHLHASLARTAALVDSTSWLGGEVHRDPATENAWHDLFGVKS